MKHINTDHKESLKFELDFGELKKYLDERFNAIEKEIESVKDKVYQETEVLYTIRQVQDILQVSRQAVYNAIKSGKLKKEKHGYAVRISSEALLEYRKGNKQKKKKKNINDSF